MIVGVLGLFVPGSVALVLAVIATLEGRYRGAGLLLAGAAVVVVALPRHTRVEFGLVLAVVLAVAAVYVVTWFVRAPAAVKANYPRAVWHRIRWRSLCRNLNLAYQDRHITDLIRHRAGSRVGRVMPTIRRREGRHMIRVPRVRIRADAHGLVARVKTIPGVGRAEFEDSAAHIANAWRCERVAVSQPRPGRLIVRGLRTDPLTVPYVMADAPAGTYDHPDITHPYLGLDEWGNHRRLSLPGQTGIVIGGLPGRGKTSLTGSLLCQWAPSPAVQFALADGKGSADHDDWHARAWLHCGDELAAAVELLEDVHAEMRRRLRVVLEVTGYRNAWHMGPTADWPMLVTLLDECQQYLDIASYKGDKDAEALARRCVALTAELIRKGRSVLMVTILATQKPTSDSLPTPIRDNAGISLCFGVKTIDAAVAVVGPDIREYGSYSPVGLRDDAYVGVLTSTLPTGADPFTRIRVPKFTEDEIAERARASSPQRRDLVGADQ